MKYICFIEDEGFVVTDRTGNFLRTTLVVNEATECANPRDWGAWLDHYKSKRGVVMGKVQL